MRSHGIGERRLHGVSTTPHEYLSGIARKIRDSIDIDANLDTIICSYLQ